MSAPRVWLGAQGWNYADWLGGFYPEGTRPRDFLGVYARAFDTVEIDSTFYAIPPENAVRGWAERTPENFVFALKLPREITHERRLRDADDELSMFFERVRGLGTKLGPVLVQLGPDFSPAERPALEAFLPRLPRDVRAAVEFRQRQWITRSTWALLREHGVALALSDGRWLPRRWLLQLLARPTADFHYLRWMGPDRSLTDFSRTQLDRSDQLDAWAGAMRGVGVDVYGYANNHFAGHSPATIRALQQRLGQAPVEPERLREQTSLF
jgi:uncharacterized protein YecE (DUF72 family)